MAAAEDDQRRAEISAINTQYPHIETSPGEEYFIHIDIPVCTSHPVGLLVPYEFDGDEPRLSYLPPVRVKILFPDGYPTESAPVFETQSSWLPKTLVEELEAHGANIWRENKQGQPVLVFVDSLFNNSADDFFNFTAKIPEVLDVAEDLIAPLVEFDREVKRINFEKESFECGVCMDTKAGTLCHRLTACSHVFCIECLQLFYNDCITKGDVSKVTCMEVGCNIKKNGRARTIKPSELLQIPIEQEIVDRYVKLKRKRRIELDPATVYCPVQSCHGPARSRKTKAHENPDSDTDESDDANSSTSNPQPQRISPDDPSTHPPPAERLATCSHCEFAFCKICKAAWHGESVDCAPRPKTELTAEEQATDDYLKVHSQQCPSCQAPAQKSNGCNHMICFRCQTNYCFLCGVVIDKDDWNDHYNTLGLGCFNKLWEHRAGDDNDLESEEENEEEEEEEDPDWDDFDNDADRDALDISWEQGLIPDIFARGEIFEGVRELYWFGGLPYGDLTWHQLSNPRHRFYQPDNETVPDPAADAAVVVAADAAPDPAANPAANPNLQADIRLLGERIEQAERELIDELDHLPRFNGNCNFALRVLGEMRRAQRHLDGPFIRNMKQNYQDEEQKEIQRTYEEMFERVFHERERQVRLAVSIVSNVIKSSVAQERRESPDEGEGEGEEDENEPHSIYSRRIRWRLFLNLEILGTRYLMARFYNSIREHEVNGNLDPVLREIQKERRQRAEYERERLIRLQGYFPPRDRERAARKSQNIGDKLFARLRLEAMLVTAARPSPDHLAQQVPPILLSCARGNYKDADGDVAKYTQLMRFSRMRRDNRDGIITMIAVASQPRNMFWRIKDEFDNTTVRLYDANAWRILGDRLRGAGRGWEEPRQQIGLRDANSLETARYFDTYQEIISKLARTSQKLIVPGLDLEAEARALLPIDDPAHALAERHWLEVDPKAVYWIMHEVFPHADGDDERLHLLMCKIRVRAYAEMCLTYSSAWCFFGNPFAANLQEEQHEAWTNFDDFEIFERTRLQFKETIGEWGPGLEWQEAREDLDEDGEGEAEGDVHSQDEEDEAQGGVNIQDGEGEAQGDVHSQDDDEEAQGGVNIQDDDDDEAQGAVNIQDEEDEAEED